MQGRLELHEAYFKEKKACFFELAGMKARGFCYSTGVAGLQLENKRGRCVFLPWQGQQIWSAFFDGRSLGMGTFFEEPEKSRALLDSYGAFLFHCGARRMGCPGPEDDHPLHGELPNARYRRASLIFGRDAQGDYLGLTGEFLYIQAFGDKYRATPLVKMHSNSAILDISFTVENLSNKPLEFMYMCHINFLPGKNAEIIQPCSWTPDNMILRTSIPAHVKPTASYLAFMESIKKSPERTKILKSEDQYDPEIVFYIENLKQNAEGEIALLQKHTQGFADYLRYNTEYLSHNVRWILKNADQQVLGLIPATCYPEGYRAEKAKGNVQIIPARGIRRIHLRTGALNPEEAEQEEKKIRALGT